MSNCSCVYVDYDGNEEFSQHKTVRARKTHKCCECHREILIGEKYEYVFGKWDGDTYTHKTCLDCMSVRDSFFCAGYIYEMIWEHLWEHLSDLGGRVSDDCLISLTPKAREMVCGMIEDIWDELDGDEDENEEVTQ